MKIAFKGLELTEGKKKYKDVILEALEEKYSPQKVTPFFVEFAEGDFETADCIALLKDKALDLLILDIEKIESRLSRIKEKSEKQALQKCLKELEREIPLCDVDFQEQEKTELKELAPLSLKPTLIKNEDTGDANCLIEEVLKKAGLVFFYTAGKKEVRSWCVKKGLDIVSCAGKIHSDLARGFIKADVINFEDLKDLHNVNEAKSKGLVKTVGRDYNINHGDIVDIKFNV